MRLVQHLDRKYCETCLPTVFNKWLQHMTSTHPMLTLGHHSVSVWYTLLYNNNTGYTTGYTIGHTIGYTTVI